MHILLPNVNDWLSMFIHSGSVCCCHNCYVRWWRQHMLLRTLVSLFWRISQCLPFWAAFRHGRLYPGHHDPRHKRDSRPGEGSNLDSGENWRRTLYSVSTPHLSGRVYLSNLTIFYLRKFIHSIKMNCSRVIYAARWHIWAEMRVLLFCIIGFAYCICNEHLQLEVNFNHLKLFLEILRLWSNLDVGLGRKSEPIVPIPTVCLHCVIFTFVSLNLVFFVCSVI